MEKAEKILDIRCFRGCDSDELTARVMKTSQGYVTMLSCNKCKETLFGIKNNPSQVHSIIKMSLGESPL